MQDISPYWRRRSRALHPQQGSLADMMYEVPHLLTTLTHCECAALMACNRQWREIVHDSAQKVFLKQPDNIWTLTKRNWHSLSVIVLHQACDASMFKQFPGYANGSLELLAQIWLSSSREGVSCTALIVRPWAKHRLRNIPAHQQHLTQAMSYLTSDAWQPLTQLRVWYSAESITKQAVLQLRCMWHLTSLNLTNLLLLPEDVGVIAQGQCRFLTNINLQQCSLSSVAVKHLAAGVWPKLEVLYLSDNELNDDGMSCLVKGSWSMLHVLWLDGNAISTTGLATLMRGTWDELWELRIDKAMFTWQSRHLLESFAFVSKLDGSSHRNIHVYRRTVGRLANAWPRLRCVHVVYVPSKPSLLTQVLSVMYTCIRMPLGVLMSFLHSHL